MIPCARTRIWRRIRIRKRLFWSDHAAIYAVPYGLTDERVSNLRHFLCFFSPFFPAGWKARVIQLCTIGQHNHEGRNNLSEKMLFSTAKVLIITNKQTFTNGTCAMNDGGGKGGKLHSPLSVKIQPKTYAVPYTVTCKSCAHKAFAGRSSACRILVRIRTNGLSLLHSFSFNVELFWINRISFSFFFFFCQLFPFNNVTC